MKGLECEALTGNKLAGRCCTEIPTAHAWPSLSGRIESKVIMRLCTSIRGDNTLATGHVPLAGCLHKWYENGQTVTSCNRTGFAIGIIHICSHVSLLQSFLSVKRSRDAARQVSDVYRNSTVI